VLAWLTLERALYGVALVCALFLRCWQLGEQPLNSVEIANSWPAWLTAHAKSAPEPPVPSGAFYYGAQWLLFWVGANSDAAARVVAAVAGAVMPLMAWAWRPWIGRLAALSLAFLLALDPWLVAISRLADGAAIGLACGFFVLSGFIQLALAGADGLPSAALASWTEWWRRATAIGFGLLLVSGVMAWNWLPVLVVFVWCYRRELDEARLFQVRYGIWLAVSALIAGTFGLVRLDAVALVGSSLGFWLAQFTGGHGELAAAAGIGDYGRAWPWVRLLVDEPLAWGLGLLGLVLSLLGKELWPDYAGPRWQRLLWLWLGYGVLLFLAPGRNPFVLPLVTLPLLIYAAGFIQKVLLASPDDLEWREAAAIGVTLVILVVSGVFWGVALVASQVFDPVMAQATAVIFLLSVVILAAYAFWSSRSHALWIGGVFVILLLLPLTIRSSWLLSQPGGVSGTAGLFSRFTHPEVRLLVEDVEAISAFRTGNPHQLPVQVQVAGRPDPILGWYLRGMRDLSWVAAPSLPDLDGEPNAGLLPLAITPVEPGAAVDPEQLRLDLADGYTGSDYHIEGSWLPAQLWPRGEPANDTPNGSAGLDEAWRAWMQPLWRWMIYRKTPALPATRDGILWAPGASS
jgi:hypothetical protein